MASELLYIADQGSPAFEASLADICSRLHIEQFGDELHPNVEGAKIIAEAVFNELAPMHKAWQELPK